MTNNLEMINQLLNLYEAGGFQFTKKWFPYTSGQIGPYYVQSIAITSDGQMYRGVIDAMIKIIELNIGVDNFDVISGGESRDWDFSNPIAVLLKKPHTKLYKNGKALGADMCGKRVLHIADLNNEGSSPRDQWVPAIQKAGGTISDILFYVDRLEDGVGEMKKLGLKSHSVISLNETAWNILIQHGKISQDVYDSLKLRMENKKEWAHTMLRSSAKKLRDMLDSTNSKTRAKAKKILDKGYPEIKLELLGIIGNLV